MFSCCCRGRPTSPVHPENEGLTEDPKTDYKSMARADTVPPQEETGDKAKSQPTQLSFLGLPVVLLSRARNTRDYNPSFNYPSLFRVLQSFQGEAAELIDYSNGSHLGTFSYKPTVYVVPRKRVAGSAQSGMKMNVNEAPFYIRASDRYGEGSSITLEAVPASAPTTLQIRCSLIDKSTQEVQECSSKVKIFYDKAQQHRYVLTFSSFAFKVAHGQLMQRAQY